MIRPTHRLGATAVALLALVSVAACGSDDDDGADPAGGDDLATTTPASAEACPGDPLTFTMIASLTGPVATSGDDVQNGVTAAMTAVNEECALGRPLEIKICDDQSNPNESLACGRTAADDSLALLDSLSSLQDGPEASGLPSVLNLGSTTFDLTSPQSYPAGAGPVVVLGEVGTAKALGATDVLFVAPDLAYTQAIFGIAQGLAAERGITLEAQFFPATTTDFAPIAAQVAGAAPDAVMLLSPTPLPVFNAFDGAGLSPAETPVITIAAFVSPDAIAELGEKIEGSYLVSQIVPPSEDDNPAIAQMREEYENVDLDFDDPSISTYAVIAWSDVHVLAAALAGLEPEQLESLDGAGVVEALEAASPIEHDTRAPIDYTTPAFEDGPLASFRIFSHEAMVLRVEDGELRPVTDFVDVTTDFELDE